MVEMPPALPPVAACEIQAARDYSVPLNALIARRQIVAERVIRQTAGASNKSSGRVYPIGIRWAQQLEFQFGITPGTFSSDQCWGARATAYILRFNEEQNLERPLSEATHPFPGIPTIRVQYLDRSNAKPLSF